MFFGIGKSEEVAQDKLYPMLDSQFEKKLAPLNSRADRIIQELKSAKLDFSEKSKELEVYSGEPYVGNIYLPNITGIKSQKNAYARALTHAIGNLALEPSSASDSYEKYKTILSNIEEVTGEMLKINASFKLVLYCYPKYVSTFRRLFSTIERLRESLRHEIETRSQDASEYAALKGKISDLQVHIEELNETNQDINALKDILSHKDKAVVEKDEAKLSESLAIKKLELSEINHEISKLSEKVNLLLIPLDRASKKLDHISARKKHLNSFIANPINMINSENEYGEFMALIKELREAIELGTVDTKNKTNTLILISTILSTDIYGTIKSIKPLQDKRHVVEAEIHTLSRTLDDIKIGRTNSERIASDVLEMENNIKELTKDIASSKATIESNFSKHYHKSISVIL